MVRRLSRAESGARWARGRAAGPGAEPPVVRGRLWEDRSVFPSFFVSILFLLSEAVMASCVRLISVCLVIKMVLAVQRSCHVLISNVRFLGTGMKGMTRFVRGIGSGYCIIIIVIIIIITMHFLKTIRTGLGKSVLQ